MDVSRIFDQARGLVDIAVNTAGTRATMFTRARSGLEASVDTVLWSGPCVAASVGAASVGEIIPGIVIKPTDYKVLCKASTPTPPDGSMLRIDRCKKTSLIGVEMKLVGKVEDSSGAHLTLFYRPQP